MSTFQEKLDEFYLNYDTVCLLKEDSETSEIVNMFKSELDYPEQLTTALLKFNKTFLKSVVMRIKVRQEKVGSKELKSDLLKYNTDLEPILDKLLSDKFKKQYEEVVTTKKVEEKVYTDDGETVLLKKKENTTVEESKTVEVEEDEVEEDDEDEEVEDEEDDVVEEELTDEEVVDKFLGKYVEKSEKCVLALVDMFESYTSYCKSFDYEAMQPSPFKKYVRTKMGKPEGKGDKSIYKGYKLVSV